MSPQYGVLDTLVLPEVNAEAMSVFLAEVAARHGDEFVVMVLDGTGWHTAQRLVVPSNMRLVPLPPWSPQLNPAEHVWDELREKWFANQRFDSLDHVENQPVAGLAALEKDAQRIASLAGFAWITCVSLNAN